MMALMYSPTRLGSAQSARATSATLPSSAPMGTAGEMSGRVTDPVLVGRRVAGTLLVASPAPAVAVKEVVE